MHMILNRYREPVFNLLRSAATIISFLDSFLKTEYFLSEDFWYAAIDYYTWYTWLLKHFVYDCWKDRLMVLRIRLYIALKLYRLVSWNWVSRSLSYCSHAYKTGKNQKEEDTVASKRHLTRVNLLLVRHFTYQNRENLFLFLILTVHF